MTVMSIFADITDRIEGVRHKLARTIFTRYLLVTSAVVIISFIIFGIVVSTMMSVRWQDEKQQQLSDNISSLAERAARYITPIEVGEDGVDNYLFSESVITSMRAVMATVGSGLDSDIFMIDTQGNLFLCSDDEMRTADSGACRHAAALDAGKSAELIRAALASPEGYYKDVGAFGGVYSEEYYIVGVPIVTKDANGNDVAVGMVYAASPARSMVQFRSDIYKFAVIAVIISSVVSFILVYLITSQQIKPLRDMTEAVANYAAGDFSVRVMVTDETEVGQLAAAFNRMADSIDQSENMRRSFVANVSHELKTPMTTISGFVDGILDGTIPQEKQNQYLSIVSDETKRLSRLVRSMLDLSKIDSGEMRLNKSKFDITNTVFETLMAFEHRIEEKNIEILGMESVRSLIVNGDPDLIHQVIYNLVENAIKFTNEGGYIRIKIFHKERQAHVSIANSGIGIPSEDLPHIFERFYKTDKSRSQDKSGVGLGLYIVKTVIKLHKGGIEARSSEGNFCEFEFHIPL